ncbi:DUF6250 domain-containing protein [Sphingomonas sp. H39-1-10]|uniref:DUF6250 domain-containing protein n=1 Tax=Sphingomonas pollutisoli TaxID=3030829 RepID=UPI0023B99E4F|nr:DUF6250 domain-containing protein [Sphingomonas pollutisoli]MDF0489299.1 DUF6250 domain-containing protein [Sphingomonas pollutisoli]
MSIGVVLASIAAPTAAQAPLTDWRIEAESADAEITERGGIIDIDTPKGLTLWWTKPIIAPTTITFEAMAISAGGANDTVSDLNAFWMATNNDGSSVLSKRRSGVFAAYDDLRAYYVGIGGNRNTTTRFRRYMGVPGNRPLLPEHDRAGPADLLVPNRWTRIALIADGHTVAVERDGQRLFTLDDARPYTRGHWGLRTTWSHLRIRRVSVTHL